MKKQNKPYFYLTKKDIISGSSFKGVNYVARKELGKLRKRSKRTPYIRSKYFKGEKIFLNLYWSHLHEKHKKERVRRLRYFSCSLDVLRNTTLSSSVFDNPKNKKEILHRFYGKTRSGDKFIVQVKENKKSGKKYFISCFPL